MPKSDRPNREQARHVLDLLRAGRTDPDLWTVRERAAVSVFHRWAYGAPMGERTIRAGDRPDPLPSELLGGVAFVLSAEVLDRLPLLRRDPGDGNGDRIEPGRERQDADEGDTEDPRRPEAVEEARRFLGLQGAGNVYLDDAEQWEPDASLGASPETTALMRLDRLLGNQQWLNPTATGRVRGVVLGALRAWHRRQPDLDEVVDDAADQQDRPDLHMPAPDADAVYAAQVVGRAQQLVRNLLAEGSRGPRRSPFGTATMIEDEVLRERVPVDDAVRAAAQRAEYARTHPPQELHVAGPGTVTCDGARLEVVYEPAQAMRATTDQTGQPLPEGPEPHPIAEDPRRPRLDHFPDDAILLTYPEIRRLIALHLDTCWTQGHLARAMRDGESGLRLGEVLDVPR